jgi:hypothetical protein
MFVNAEDRFTEPEPGPRPSVDPKPQPAPPPPPPQFARFNGYWTDDFGDTWAVSVDRAGRAQAIATGGVFAGSQLTGAFNGRQFEFAVGNAYGVGSAVGTFDGKCHITYQTLDPYGSGRMLNANLHINHQPGAPCP